MSDEAGSVGRSPSAESSKSEVATVGPVLDGGETGQAVVAAIRSLNEGVLVVDRGAYLRVLVPSRCVLSRVAVEEALGRPFRFPSDLLALMPAFKGWIEIGEEQVSWSVEGR